jgi:non-reducing end alpha-L-arabinofuranosidase
MLPRAALALCILGRAASAPSSAAEGPCDLLVAAGNPCVAAHSTVRALYGRYSGHLYQVARPDNSTADIGVLEAGGFADIAAHEKFCAAGECVIKIIYDQSPEGNHLGQRITTVPGQGRDVHKMVNASRHRITVRGGVQVFGMWFDPGHGYNVDNTTGVPKGNDPESIYAVMSGKRFNEHCCFDYGNSEDTITATKTGPNDYGCGSMEAIYFGDSRWVPHSPWTAPDGNRGHGSGPWVGADLEAGMYYGGGNSTRVNEQNTPLTSEFVSLSLKGREDGFTLKGGDATQGPLKTMYDGPRPDEKIAADCGSGNHYQPMRKQGAIILATGGDNSNGAEGNFYEGFMARGYASDATDAAIQANIIAVGYRNTS